MRMAEPGLYLVTSSGEKSALATEDGGGDRELLIDVLAEHLSLGEIMAAEEAILDARADD